MQSAKAHFDGEDDGITALKPLLTRVENWQTFLKGGVDEATLEALRRHGRSGHPLGSDAFFKKLERLLERDVKPRRPGRPKTRPPATANR